MPNYRGIFPGTFTMGNMLCGFLAILESFEGNVITACWLVMVAVLLDLLDGKAARLTGATSALGGQLDSFSDFLSFGLAPGIVAYNAQLSQMSKWGWLLPALFFMAAAFRLARFNLLAQEDEKGDYMGLPVPVAATAIVTYIIASHQFWGELRYEEVLVSMIAVLAILMVSNIQYDSIPDNISTPRNRFRLAVILVCSVIIVIHPRLLLFPFCAAFILFGIAREAYRLVTRAGHMRMGKSQMSADSEEKTTDDTE